MLKNVLFTFYEFSFAPLPDKIIGKPFCEFSSIQHPLVRAEIELFANKFFVESHQG